MIKTYSQKNDRTGLTEWHYFFMALGATFFVASEFSKNPRDRILLSTESKIASAISTLL